MNAARRHKSVAGPAAICRTSGAITGSPPSLSPKRESTTAQCSGVRWCEWSPVTPFRRVCTCKRTHAVMADMRRRGGSTCLCVVRAPCCCLRVRSLSVQCRGVPCM